jgi:hypothetical protein
VSASEDFILNKATDQTPEQLHVQDVSSEISVRPSRKQFIEPAVHAPLDVLEATTSFLFVTADTSVVS